MKLYKSFSFMFLSVFFNLTVHKTHLSSRTDNQSDLSIKLFATYLRTWQCEAKQKIVHCHGQFNMVATTSFSLLNVLRFHNQSLD